MSTFIFVTLGLSTAAALAPCDPLALFPRHHLPSMCLDRRGYVLMATIEVVGDVNDVIQGHVRPECATRVLRADAARAGFIVGSPRSLDSMGEMIMVNGHSFCCSTSADDLHTTLSGRAVYTTGACLLPKTAEPTRRVVLRDLSWSELCEAAVESGGGGGSGSSRGVVFTGIVRFETLRAIQVSAPPIYEESIFSNLERYYRVPPVEQPDKTCFVMGAASASCRGGVERFLYAGGTGIAGRDAAETVAVTHHTHALELCAGCSNEEEITPETARGVYHLSGDAVVREASIEIFEIDDVVEHVDGLEVCTA